ncbi:lysylphosphatidylglycerol synthase transmembrane domain-containing protein [Sinosporangium siamense]|uniref:Membrane protein n=1 Tax=Sinosporangium siamense TaxID=1367973 RepID=A0A919RFU1_9ACTN|nr:lysylphosphatidylglycerol synthase transmembrane domain-containing protein [Sinosporangium siamense]GII91014.1 membrane protein [Sinosporangium siamense]
MLRIVLALIALGFLGYGLARDWDETTAALTKLSWWSIIGSFAVVMLGQGLMLVAWRATVSGLGSPLPYGVAARIMCVGQLGKYVPGTVWAYAAMMELGRDHGCPPRRTFAGTSLALVISLGCALTLAAATLPLTAQDLIRQAWYLVALIPVILICMHPRVLAWGLNLAMRIARREPLERDIPGSAVLIAAATSMIAWVLYGVQVWLITSDLSPGTDNWTLLLVSAGAYAIGWATGLLFVVAPAGIGVREGAMLLALTPLIGASNALVAAVVTRLVVTLCDLSWAGIGWLLGRRARTTAQRTPEPVAEPSS